METTKSIRVFIAYAHEDDYYRCELDKHLTVMKRNGLIADWHDRKIVPGAEWQGEIDTNLHSAHIILLLVSSDFLSSTYCNDVEMKQALEMHTAGKACVIPVILRRVNWQDGPLGSLHALPKDGEPVSSWNSQDDAFSDIVLGIKTAIENLTVVNGSTSTNLTPKPHSKININRLQRPATGLFGRDTFLKEITKALNNPAVTVLGIIADGGIGKTALLWEWLTHLSTEEYDLSHVFAWPFYDREKHENTTSDAFFTNAFEAFSSQPSPADIRTADYRADFLLTEYNATKKILVLDGLEVLQSPLEHSFGEILDPGIRAFLENATIRMMQHDQRLILVTSRVSLTSLSKHPGYRELSLETLEPKHGKRLLSELEVKGNDEELKLASDENNGHCLCLVLLGKLIANHFPDKHIRNRHQIYTLADDDLVQRDKQYLTQAHRIMKFYGELVRNKPERILLEMMGLFHRPMRDPERKHLLQYAKFTNSLRDEKLNTVLDQNMSATSAKLEDYGLLVPNQGIGTSAVRSIWDCHPLVREYFREVLHKDKEAWLDAHRVLFEYFCDAVPVRPHNTTQMFPLYRAIHHGCQAHLMEKSLKIYRERMLHGQAEGFATNYLGLVCEDVEALDRFFKVDVKPIEVLSELDFSFLRGRLAFSLTYLGRLDEAIHCREQERRFFEERKEYMNIGNACDNLSSLYLMRGHIVNAGKAAEDAVRASSKANDWGQQMRAQCRRGAVLFFKDDMDGCRNAFEEAQRLQVEGEATRSTVHADYGIFYRYYKFENAYSKTDYEKLLHDAESAEQLDANWLIPKGFDTMFKAVAKWKMGKENDAGILFNQAKSTLKESGAIAYLANFFLTETDFELSRGRSDRAKECLVEAQRIAERYRMPLITIDCNLRKAKVFVKQKQIQSARQAIEKSEENIKAYFYHIRTLDLTMLKGELALLEGKHGDAGLLFNEARKMIDDTGRKSHLERCMINIQRL